MNDEYRKLRRERAEWIQKLETAEQSLGLPNRIRDRDIEVAETNIRWLNKEISELDNLI